MWRALLLAMCCAWAGCSLLRAPVDDPDAADAGPDNDDAVPTITSIDGTGTARDIVNGPELDGAVPASHRLQDTLRIGGAHLDVVTSAALIDNAGVSTPLALLEASSSTERDMRLPPTVSAALYTLVLVAAGGEAQAQVFLLQGEQGVQGDVGLTALVDTTALEPGIECAAGGISVTTGIDTNRDGTLNDDEVDAEKTKTVCAPTADDALNCTDAGCVLTQPLRVEGSITADLVDTRALTAITADVDDVVANAISASTTTPWPLATSTLSRSPRKSSCALPLRASMVGGSRAPSTSSSRKPSRCLPRCA
jgi:hypothetical protein